MRGRLRTAAMLAVVPFVLSGCDLLFAGLYGPMDPFPEPDLGPSVVYDSGVATLEITQTDTTETVTLDQLGPNSIMDSYMGATVTWRNDDGWILRLNAYSFADPAAGGFPGSVSGDITFDRIGDNELWTAGGYTSAAGNRCIVDISEMSETRVSGRANCRGLRWSDATGGFGFGEPVFIEGQDPFDVTVTFEAAPFEGAPSSAS